MTVRKRLKKFIYITALTLIAGLVYALISYKFKIGIPCIIKSFFGIECAGCGMTRATVSFLSGDVKGAFLYNAIFPVYWFEIISVFISSGIRYIKNGVLQIRGISIVSDVLIITVIVAYGILRFVKQLMVLI